MLPPMPPKISMYGHISSRTPTLIEENMHSVTKSLSVGFGEGKVHSQLSRKRGWFASIDLRLRVLHLGTNALHPNVYAMLEFTMSMEAFPWILALHDICSNRFASVACLPNLSKYGKSICVNVNGFLIQPLQRAYFLHGECMDGPLHFIATPVPRFHRVLHLRVIVYLHDLETELKYQRLAAFCVSFKLEEGSADPDPKEPNLFGQRTATAKQHGKPSVEAALVLRWIAADDPGTRVPCQRALLGQDTILVEGSGGRRSRE